MRIFAVLAIAALMGCGVDGAPITPSANVGIQIGPDGVRPTVGVQVKKGPVTVATGTEGTAAGVTF